MNMYRLHHLSRTGVVIHKNYVFSVTSRSRTFSFGGNIELVLTNKQKKKCFIGITQYRNNVDIKIKLIRYDPNGVPNFFLSEQCHLYISGFV
jgi:hypothetical protein